MTCKRKTQFLACSLALLLALPASGVASAQAGFDRAALMDRGEVFVVAAHDAYRNQADECLAEGEKACALFFDRRADEIDAGGELYTLVVPAVGMAAASDPSALGPEFNETYSLITSEAADRAPRDVAAVMVSYEGWANATYGGDAAEALWWHDRWQAALTHVTGKPDDAPADPWRVSSVAP